MNLNPDNLTHIISFINTKFKQAVQDGVKFRHMCVRHTIAYRIQNYIDRELECAAINTTQHSELIEHLCAFITYNK